MRSIRRPRSGTKLSFPSLPALMCVAVLYTLTGCLVAPTTVSRTVNGIWSGTDLLTVESRYTTVTPNEPHYADESAQDWEYVLALWPEGDRGRSRELARVPEDEFTAGGSIAYAPLYWDRDAEVISVGDWTQPYLITFSDDDWRRRPLERPESLKLLLDFPAEVTDLAPTDVVLSPSGGAVAVLWEFTYQPDPASLELYHNYIMAFYHAADARFAYARRLSDQPPGGSPAPESGPIPVDLTISSLAPYASLMGHTEAPLWNRIIWSADGTGVFVVETVSDTAVYLAWEPSAPDPPQPVQPARVPASAIPTASGPVGPHGRAAVISSAGNESTLTIRELTAWTAFGDAGTIPVADATY